MADSLPLQKAFWGAFKAYGLRVLASLPFMEWNAASASTATLYKNGH